mgnify:CR=1 FL=1
MKYKVKVLNKFFALVLVVLLGSSFLLSACSKNGSAHIDVSAEPIVAEIGEPYAVPIPDVVDEDGVILEGYDVKIASIKNSAGEDVYFSNGEILIESPTLVEILYFADGVDDAVQKVDFKKTKPPVLNITQDNFPAIVYNGQWVKIPSITAEGSIEEKTTLNVNWYSEEGAEPELITDDATASEFQVTKKDGFYEVKIYVEDAYGNGQTSAFRMTVNSAQTAPEGSVSLSKYAADKAVNVTVPSEEVKGEITKVIDKNSGAELSFTLLTDVSEGMTGIAFSQETVSSFDSGKKEIEFVTDAGNTEIELFIWDMMISNETELIEFDGLIKAVDTEAEAVTGYYCLDQDIDMTDSDYVVGDVYGDLRLDDPNSETSCYFAGIFDGNGHSITGLTTGNQGMFYAVTTDAAIKNLAIIDAYALGYKADGTEAEKNVSHGSNILGEIITGTLMNIYVSGSVGNGRWSYSGVVNQMRAVNIQGCIFNIETRADVNPNNDSAFGMWVTSDSRYNIGQTSGINLITSSEQEMLWFKDDIDSIGHFKDEKSCYDGIDMSVYYEFWEKKSDGIYFHGKKVVSAVAVPVDLEGEYDLSKYESDAATILTFEKSVINGDIVKVLDKDMHEIAFTPVQEVPKGKVAVSFQKDTINSMVSGPQAIQIKTSTEYTYNLKLNVWDMMISNEADLKEFDSLRAKATDKSNPLSGYYCIDKDIDMSASSFVVGDVSGNSFSGEAGTSYFGGVFDGRGHTIHGLKAGNKGLFDYTTESMVVKNIVLTDVYSLSYKADGMSAEQNVTHGSHILGTWFAGNMENVFVSGSFGTGRWDVNAGGVIGRIATNNKKGYIKNCIFDVEMREDAQKVTYTGVIGVGYEDAPLDNVVIITDTEKVITNLSKGETKPANNFNNEEFRVYKTVSACINGEKQTEFGSVISIKDDGIYFNNVKVSEIETAA